MAEVVPGILYVADASGQVTYASRRGTEWTGVSLLGLGYESIVHPEDLDRVRSATALCIANEAPLDIAFRARMTDGAYRWLQARSFPARISESIQWFGVALDIDAQKQLEVRLRSKTDDLLAVNQQLAESNQALQRLAAVIAHDFLSPLASMTSAIAWILEERGSALGESGLEDMFRLQQTVERMRAFVDAVLQYSRIDAGLSDRGWFDCGKTLASALRSLPPEVEPSRATITFDPLPEVFGDASLLAQVFRNLVSHALSHRRSDLPPKIHISASEGPDEWTFSIADNGADLDGSAPAAVFELFPGVRGRKAGTGMGLPVCRKIVELHGGRIWLEPEPGQGSRFFFTIPKHGSSESPNKPEKLARAAG